MTTTETKSVAEVTGTMLELIESTHWTQEKLACPVYPKKRVRVQNSWYENNPDGYHYEDQADFSQRPIKTTYCLVGLVIKALGLKVAGEPTEERNFDENGALKEKPDEFIATIDALARKLGEKAAITRNLWAKYRRPESVCEGQVQALETWNDHRDREKEEVVELIRDTHNAATSA